MSLVRQAGSIWYAITDDALDDSGYVLYLKSTGHVAKCAAGELPIGVAFKSTKNPVTGTAESSVEIAIISDGVAEVQYYLTAGDSDINIGDLVMAHQSQAGYVTKYSEDDVGASFDQTKVNNAIKKSMYIVGVALESASAPSSGSTTGKIKVLLRLGRR